MKIKVLINDWDYDDIWTPEECHGEVQYIDPIFNRTGWYRQGEKCWNEFYNGIKWIAFTYDGLIHTFNHEMDIFNHIPLLEKERKAIQIIWHLIPKSLKEKYYMDNHIRELKEVTYNALKTRKRLGY